MTVQAKALQNLLKHDYELYLKSEHEKKEIQRLRTKMTLMRKNRIPKKSPKPRLNSSQRAF